MKLPPVDCVRYAWETLLGIPVPSELDPGRYAVNRIAETAKAHQALRAKRQAQKAARLAA